MNWRFFKRCLPWLTENFHPSHLQAPISMTCLTYRFAARDWCGYWIAFLLSQTLSCLSRIEVTNSQSTLGVADCRRIGETS